MNGFCAEKFWLQMSCDLVLLPMESWAGKLTPSTKVFRCSISASSGSLSLRLALLSNYSKTSFEKNCFSAWASTLNMGLINKVDEGLTLETSAKHHIPQATNIPYQPC